MKNEKCRNILIFVVLLIGILFLYKAGVFEEPFSFGEAYTKLGDFSFDELFAIYHTGGDSGLSPYTISMVVELDEGDVVTGCSVSGGVVGTTKCDIECVGWAPVGYGSYCLAGQSYDDDDCPESRPCEKKSNCVSMSPTSVTVGSKTVPVIDGKFSASEIGFEGYKSSFGVTFTANPGGIFSNLNVNCGEGVCQPNWVYAGWGGCHAATTDYELSLGPFIRARWRSDTVCGLEKEIEKEACCNTDDDCGACSKECSGNKCVDKVLPVKPDDCSVFLPFPGCVWDSDVPDCWECNTDDDCASCGARCNGHECENLYYTQEVPPYGDCIVWVDYPTCDYDDSGCWTDWFCFDTDEDFNPINVCEVRSKLPVFASLLERCYETDAICEQSYWELRDPECLGQRCTLECPFGVVEGSCGCECLPEPEPEPCSLDNCELPLIRPACAGEWVISDEDDCLCDWECDVGDDGDDDGDVDDGDEDEEPESERTDLEWALIIIGGLVALTFVSRMFGK